MEPDKTKKNTVFNMVKSIFSIIYPLITFPYISRVLLAENVGKVNFGNSIISYFSLIASLGVTTYAVRECSRYKNDKESLAKVSSEIFSINIWSTLIAYFALGVTLLCARELENYRKLIIIQSTTIIFTTLGADWLNTAMEDFRYIAVRTVLMQAASIILMFVFVRKTDDYLKYAVISVMASSGANIVNIFYRKRFCTTRFVFKCNLKKHLPSILVLFSLIITQTIYTTSDITILGLIKGDYQVGLYSTSVKIYNIINALVASVAWVVIPQLSVSYSENDYSKVNELIKYSLNFIIVLGLPCIVGMNLISREMIVLIAGIEYVDAALSLKILSFSLFFSFLGGWVGNTMLLPAGKEKVCLCASIASALVNIILNLLLIPIWGLYAAAATTAFAEFVGFTIQCFFIGKKIKIDGVLKMLIGPLCGCVSICSVGLVIKRFVTSDYLIAILTILFGALVYFIVLLITRNEFMLGFVKPIYNNLLKKGKQ